MERQSTQRDTTPDPINAGSDGLPHWYREDEQTAWDRVKGALKRDWEQTKHDFSDQSGQALNQDVGHTIAQAVGALRLPPSGVPNPPDFDSFEDAEPALRYGYAAATYFGRPNWDTDLEAAMKTEWDSLRTGRDFQGARGYIRRGWETGRAAMVATERHEDQTPTLELPRVLGQEDEVFSVLNGLIETCKDGEAGLQQAADDTLDYSLKALFTGLAAQRADFAAELQSQVRRYGAYPKENGSVSGALHRGWEGVKTSLGGRDDPAILADCERGEANAMQRYEAASQSDMPLALENVITRQYEAIRRSHEEVRDLRIQTE